MGKEIKFRISLNIDGKEQLGTITTNVKDFRKKWDEAESSTQRYSRALMDLSNKISIIEGLGSAVNDLSTKLNDFQRKSVSAQQQTGLMGSELSSLRGEVQAVADTYGKDFTEVLTGVSRLMKGFGIDADAAMQLVRDGLMSGADAGGQMFDMLQEYPAYFKEAGMSAEQFMAVLVNGANMGVFNDKAADTIKEGNLRLREMTTATAQALDGIGLSSAQIQAELKSGMTTTFEVMQQVGAKLKELPQTSAEVGTAIADIFGGPGEDAGLAYIESLSDMELSMDALKSKASDTSKALDGQVDTLTVLNTAIATVVDAFGVLPSLQPFLNITSQIGMTLTGIGSLVSALKALNLGMAATKIRSALVGAGNVLLGTTATGAAVGVSTMTMALRALMAATGVGIAVTALGMAVSALSDYFDGSAKSADKAGNAIEGSAKKVDAAQAAYNTTFKQTFGGMMSQYTKLQSQWKALSDVHAKNDWIKSNQNAFESLHLSVKSVADAEDVLVKNTAKIQEAFKARAEAAAIQSQLESLYAQKIQLEETRSTLKAKAGSKLVKAGQVANDSVFDSRWHYRDDQGTMRYSKEGAARLNAGTLATPRTDAAISALDKKISGLAGRLTGISLDDYVPAAPAGGSSGGRTTPSSRNSPSSRVAEAGSLDWYDEQIRKLRSQMTGTGNVETATSLNAEIAKLEGEQKALKVRIGLEKPAQAEVDTWMSGLRKQIEEKQKTLEGNLDVGARLKVLGEIADLQSQIDAATYGKVSISAPVEPAYITQGSDADKRASYRNAQSRVSQIRSDLDIGIIADKGAAQQQVDEINAQLARLGLKPLSLDVDTEDAESNLDSFFSSVGNIDLSSFSSIQTGLQGFVDNWDKMSDMEKGFSAAGAAASSLGSAMQQLGSDSAAAKAGMIAAALGQLALSYAMALANASATAGWVGWLAFGLSGLATLMTIMQTIGAFASGGIVGGNSKSGDKLLARVNSGEMILNSQQQARLWQLVNGSYHGISTGYDRPDVLSDVRNLAGAQGSAEQMVTVNIKSNTRYLVTEIENIKKVMRKSGRAV